uniref:Uncharacterized protein n=1 Tax=Arundo donax TaxID=35708 RepID=A0A0A9GZH3_ARUDO
MADDIRQRIETNAISLQCNSTNSLKYRLILMQQPSSKGIFHPGHWTKDYSVS